MKIKLLPLIGILILIHSSGCIPPKAEEPWEGMSENTLRVTIYEFFPFEDTTTGDNIHTQIKERLNQRASVIIASYITLNLSRNKISPETDIVLNKLINDIIDSGKPIDFECNEANYCSAHCDYDITEFRKNLELINNQ